MKFASKVLIVVDLLQLQAFQDPHLGHWVISVLVIKAMDMFVSLALRSLARILARLVVLPTFLCLCHVLIYVPACLSCCDAWQKLPCCRETGYWLTVGCDCPPSWVLSFSGRFGLQPDIQGWSHPSAVCSFLPLGASWRRLHALMQKCKNAVFLWFFVLIFYWVQN